MNKRKQRDFEDHIESIDIELINSLKKKINGNDSDFIKQSTPSPPKLNNDENLFFVQLLDKTLNINLLCDKKKLTKNCIENPNCFHHLGQICHSYDFDHYIKENLIKNLLVTNKKQSSSPQPQQSITINDNDDGEEMKKEDIEYTNNDGDSNDNVVNDYDDDNQFTDIKEREILNQPIGLKNLGATCYVNSLLQLLFMNREFRKLILEFRLPCDNINSVGVVINDKEIIIDQLRTLFLNMQFNRNTVFDPTDFVNSLELSNSIHQDIQEFFILFIGLIESQLDIYNNNNSNNINTNFLKQLFQGNYNYTTECLKCHSKYFSPSSFYEIQLQIDGFEGLEESLKGFLSKEKLTGDDKYFCKNCNLKKDCSRSIQLSTIPPYLCFQLLRYTFDKVNFRKKKLHNSFTFPLELNLLTVINDYDHKNSIETENEKATKNNNDNHHQNNSIETENEKETKNNNFNSTNDIKHQFYVLKDTILDENENDKLIYNQTNFYRIIQQIENNRIEKEREIFQLFKSDLFLDKYKHSFFDIVKFNFKNIQTTTGNTNNSNNNNNNNNNNISTSINISNLKNKKDKEEDFIYELSGILMHQGAGTNGGHYICQIKDDVTGDWWKFNDETVEKIDIKSLGKDNNKERRKKKEIEDGTISSSTAYMVVYSKKNRNSKISKEDGNIAGGHHDDPLKNLNNLSNRLLDRLQEIDNTFTTHKNSFDTEFEKLRIQWKQRIDNFKKIEPLLKVDQHDDEVYIDGNYKKSKNSKKIIINLDDSPEDEEDLLLEKTKKQSLLEEKNKKQYYWLNVEWIKGWIKGENYPIDNSNLQCGHGLLSPNKLESMKRISPMAWDLLYSLMGGGPVFNQSSVCSECLYSICFQTKEKTTNKNLKDYYISLEKPQTIEPKLKRSSKNNNNQNTTTVIPKEFYISKIWFNSWKKSNIEKIQSTNPTDNISCPHDNLNLDEKDRLPITKETWSYFHSLYPNSIELPIKKNYNQKKDDDDKEKEKQDDDEACLTCKIEEDNFANKLNQKLKIAKEEKKEMKDLLALLSLKSKIKRPIISLGEFCVISKQWLNNWQSTILNPNVDQQQQDNDESNQLNNEKGEKVGFQLLDQNVSSTDDDVGSCNGIKMIDNSEFLCLEHSKFKYDLSNSQSIKQLSTYSLVDNTSTFFDINLPFILIPKQIYEKLVLKYKSKDNITIEFKDNQLKDPYSLCNDCFLAQKEIELKKRLTYNDVSVYIHKINEKDSEFDLKYYSYPASFRTQRSYRHEISPISCDFTIEELKLTICSFIGIPTYQQRLFIISNEEADNSKIIELKEHDFGVSWYKIIPNQIIVLKVIENDFGSFIEDSTSSNGNIETGFKGSVFNK